MCKAPKPPAPKEPKKPQYLRNRYLDAEFGGSGAVDGIRQGRSALRVDLGADTGLGIAPQAQPAAAPVHTTVTPQPVGLPGISARRRATR